MQVFLDLCMSLENTSISTPCFFGKAPAHVIFRGGSRFCNINSTDVRHNYFPPLLRLKIVHPKKLIHRFMHVLCILVCLYMVQLYSLQVLVVHLLVCWTRERNGCWLRQLVHYAGFQQKDFAPILRCCD